MPTYTMRDRETGEVFDCIMRMSQYDEYLQNNPNIERYHDECPAIVGGVSIRDKVPAGFKEVLSKVAEAHSGSNFGQSYGQKSIKEARTAEVVKKHVDRIVKRVAP